MAAIFPAVDLPTGDAEHGLGTGQVHAFLRLWLPYLLTFRAGAISARGTARRGAWSERVPDQRSSRPTSMKIEASRGSCVV